MFSDAESSFQLDAANAGSVREIDHMNDVFFLSCFLIYI